MTSIHLLVLVHGMWGNPGHLAEVARIIQEVKATPADDGAQLKVILAETNRDESTYDGIDWGGERVAQEVTKQVDELTASGNMITKFSILGYSLGGLVSRYVVGILSQRGFFDKVTPISFTTIATPHLGLPKYHPVLSTLPSTLGPKLLSRTGEQFFCTDKWANTGKSLLEVMADPDMIFYQALASFKHIRAYANGINDTTVPYWTASISTEDPYATYETSGLEIEFDEDYKPIISTSTLPLVPPTPTPKPRIFTRSWFKQKSSKPALPPFLQFKFPGNLLVYIAIPILLPLILSLAITRMALSARSSRARIRLLEKDTELHSQSLLHILSKLERQVEDAVVDILEDPAMTSNQDDNAKPSGQVPRHTILTPIQKKMAQQLNTLPIQKEVAWFPHVRNSHAVIVSRDVKRFAFHREGEGVIRHWADSFSL